VEFENALFDRLASPARPTLRDQANASLNEWAAPDGDRAVPHRSESIINKTWISRMKPFCWSGHIMRDEDPPHVVEFV